MEFFGCILHGHDKKEMLLDLCKERAQTLVELKASIDGILDNSSLYEDKGVHKFIKEDTIAMLKEYIGILENKPY